MHIDELANLCEKPRKSGAGWTVCCPVHGEKNPSMSIKEGRKGDIIAHCFACGANGMDLADAAPGKAARPALETKLYQGL